MKTETSTQWFIGPKPSVFIDSFISVKPALV